MDFLLPGPCDNRCQREHVPALYAWRSEERSNLDTLMERSSLAGVNVGVSERVLQPLTPRVTRLRKRSFPAGVEQQTTRPDQHFESQNTDHTRRAPPKALLPVRCRTASPEHSLQCCTSSSSSSPIFEHRNFGLGQARCNLTFETHHSHERPVDQGKVSSAQNLCVVASATPEVTSPCMHALDTPPSSRMSPRRPPHVEQSWGVKQVLRHHCSQALRGLHDFLPIR